MNLFSMLASGSGRVLKTQTFNSNASFIVPAGVTILESLVGRGGAGTPSSSTIERDSAQGSLVRGFATGSGPNLGALSWADMNQDVIPLANAVNSGGNGVYRLFDYTGYPNSNSFQASDRDSTWRGAVANTVEIYYSPGWKFSGPVQAGDYGFFLIQYDARVTIPATPGASGSGFGRTFPGGSTGPAQPVTYNGVAVNPGQNYSLVVPSGGFITISYYE